MSYSHTLKESYSLCVSKEDRAVVQYLTLGLQLIPMEFGNASEIRKAVKMSNMVSEKCHLHNRS